MNRRTAVSLVVIAAVGIPSAFAIHLLLQHESEPAAAEREEVTRLVGTLTVERGEYVEQVEAIGTVRAMREVALAASVGGPVVWRHPSLEAGSRFAAGDELCRIDPVPYEEAVKRARALGDQSRARREGLATRKAGLEELAALAEGDLAISKREVARQQKLLASGSTAQAARDVAETRMRGDLTRAASLRSELAGIAPQLAELGAALAAHESALRLAERDLRLTTVRAPFACRVADKRVEVGQVVAPGAVLVMAIDDTTLEVPLEFDAATAAAIALEAPVELRAAAIPRGRWSGVVERVGAAIEPRNRSLPVYVRVLDPEREPRLRPGQFVRAVVPAARHADVIALPRRIVDHGTVLVVDGDRARRRAVEVRATLHDTVLVTQGLEPGERVITTNLDALIDGGRIRTRGAEGDKAPLPQAASESAAAPAAAASGASQ